MESPGAKGFIEPCGGVPQGSSRLNERVSQVRVMSGSAPQRQAIQSKSGQSPVSRSDALNRP
jgi:hypothetical protein